MSINVDAIIERAIANGELDNLPGKAKPLELIDDSAVPEEYRNSFRIMKNAGITPPEVTAMNELAALREELTETSDPDERHALAIRIACHESVLRLKLERLNKR